MPEWDALKGRAHWSFQPSDVARHFRRLSLMVHPDKNGGSSSAAAAFQAVVAAQGVLGDDKLRQQYAHRLREKVRSGAEGSAGERRGAARGARGPGERPGAKAADKRRSRGRAELWD